MLKWGKEIYMPDFVELLFSYSLCSMKLSTVRFVSVIYYVWTFILKFANAHCAKRGLAGFCSLIVIACILLDRESQFHRDEATSIMKKIPKYSNE